MVVCAAARELKYLNWFTVDEAGAHDT